MSAFEPFLYGKYIILNRIAIGGMAEVFFAKSYGVRGFQRLLVIKRILPNLSKDEEFIEMFIDEAKISVELNHANICQVTDLGKIDDNYFIAMEFVNGKDLRAILKKSYILQSVIPVHVIVFIIAEILKGLDYAHKREDTITGRSFSVIHRDISPQNIMVSYHGDVKIVDFGIAKTESKLHRTQAGVLKGKFAYMSPEQAMGLDLDPRTDIFSTAIILYELLAGERLFLGDTDFQTLENIKKCNIPSLLEKNASVPPELNQILVKALSKKADDRFQTAGDMQLALTKLLYANYPDFQPDQATQFLQHLFKDEIKAENNALKSALSKISEEQIHKAENASSLDQDNQHHQTIVSPAALHPKDLRHNLSKQIQNISQWSMLGKSALLLAISFAFYLLIKLFLVGDAPPSRKNVQQNIPPKQSSQATQSTFVFSSIPNEANVTINAEKKGLTELRIVLPTHKFFDIEISKKGYIPIKKEIQTSPHQTNFTFQLEKIKPSLGALKIQTEPDGVKIFLDNEDTGLNTPSDLKNLQLNQSYKVVLKKDGYRSVTRNILIEQPSHNITIKLEKITATLKVHTVPKSALVKIDGQKENHTIEGLQPNKSYIVTVSKAGYTTVTKTIEIQNNYTELDIELKRKEIKKGSLSVSATPWAQVIVNGDVIGPSPILNHRLPVGKHEVTLRHPDFDDVKKSITIQEGQNNKIIIDLRTP